MKYLLIFGLLALTSIANAQVVPIADNAFLGLLLVHDPVIDTNGDTQIQISEAEAVIHLNINNRLGYHVESLEGIEYFINLESLSARSHYQLESVDLTQMPNLRDINFTACGLTQINISQNPLLEELALSLNPLGVLNISNNQELRRVFCDNCELVKLIHDGNPNLEDLHIPDNYLINLFLSDLSALRQLDVRSNRLQQLDIQNGNNHNMITMLAQGNPDLLCVQVDDETADPECYIHIGLLGWCINPWTNYSEDCLFGVGEKSPGLAKLVPNPVTDNLTIISESTVIQSITIYSTSGEKVLQSTENQLASSMDLSSLNSGLYLVEILTNNGKELYKVIKN